MTEPITAEPMTDDRLAEIKARNARDVQLYDTVGTSEAEADRFYLLAEVDRLRTQVAEMAEDSQFLNALRNAGVDNWSGYDYALDIVAERKQEAGEES